MPQQFFEDSNIPIPDLPAEPMRDPSSPTGYSTSTTTSYTISPEEVAAGNARANAQAAYQEAMAMAQRKQQAEAQLATLPVMQQIAVQNMLERQQENRIQHEQDKIKLGMAKKKLKSDLDLAEKRGQAAAQKFINDQGKSEWYAGAAKANHSPAEHNKITGTMPPNPTAEDLNIIFGNHQQGADYQGWLAKQKYLQAESDWKLAQKAATSEMAQSLPESDKAKLNAKVEEKKAAMDALEAGLTGALPIPVRTGGTNAPVGTKTIQSGKYKVRY